MLQSMGSPRVRYDLGTEQQQQQVWEMNTLSSCLEDLSLVTASMSLGGGVLSLGTRTETCRAQHSRDRKHHS